MDVGMRTMFMEPRASASSRPIQLLGSTLLNPDQGSGMKSPILVRCDNIFENILPDQDPVLASHLKKQGVQPQLFLLRWIRLLFAREFHIDDTLLIWDSIFAHAYLTNSLGDCVKSNVKTIKNTSDSRQVALATSKALPLVDRLALSMLQYLRNQLLELDNTGCIRRLLKFPPTECVMDLVTVSLGTKKVSSLEAGDVGSEALAVGGKATATRPRSLEAVPAPLPIHLTHSSQSLTKTFVVQQDSTPSSRIPAQPTARPPQHKSETSSAPHGDLVVDLQLSSTMLKKALKEADTCVCRADLWKIEGPCPHYLAVTTAARRLLEPVGEAVKALSTNSTQKIDGEELSSGKNNVEVVFL
eukprot:GHVN01090504.1.p1 GENE.GHVN01090504.1~~GHVN01090504.1.p1  ORF type:complete len:385 (+),score=46.48 GHVN01090504.1:86-1156(+)